MTDCTLMNELLVKPIIFVYSPIALFDMYK